MSEHPPPSLRESLTGDDSSSEERFVHLQALELTSLHLDVYTSPECREDALVHDALLTLLGEVWEKFRHLAVAEGIPQALGLALADQVWEVDLNFVTDAAIHEINREYRNKDEPTDVLSFTLLADSANSPIWASLPQVQLGSLFISLEWARRAVGLDADSDPGRSKRPEQLAYLSERFVHGMLHLLGVHHDTMEAYERVVAIQKRILDATSHSRTEAQE